MGLTVLGYIAFVVLVCGCTHAPSVPDPQEAYYDGSTPIQYSPINSGYIAFVDQGGHHYVLITTDRAANEPSAIPFVDQYGNHLFLLDPEVIAHEFTAKQKAQVAHLEGAK